MSKITDFILDAEAKIAARWRLSHSQQWALSDLLMEYIKDGELSFAELQRIAAQPFPLASDLVNMAVENVADYPHLYGDA